MQRIPFAGDTVHRGSRLLGTVPDLAIISRKKKAIRFPNSPDTADLYLYRITILFVFFIIDMIEPLFSAHKNIVFIIGIYMFKIRYHLSAEVGKKYGLRLRP